MDLISSSSVKRRTGTLIQTIGVSPKLTAGFTEKRFQKRGLRFRERADGADAVLCAFCAVAEPTVKSSRIGSGQSSSRKFCRVISVVASGFCIQEPILAKNLVEGYTRGERQSQFLLDRKSNGVGNFTSAAEQTLTGGYIEPGFIDTERLHQIRVAAVDFVDFGGVMAVFFFICGGTRTSSGHLRLACQSVSAVTMPYFFGGLVLRENNSMAAVRITADRHRHVAQFRTFQKFDGRKNRSYRSAE